ncbi:Uncharacterized protein FWK35_00035076, partial [Aphis craccivora]
MTKNRIAIPVYRTVLNNFPRSQHRPILINVGIQISIKPRWNFRKANWHTFAKSIDANIRWIKPTTNNYDRFFGIVKGAAKRCVPRGYRRDYMPCWNPESNQLYTEYQKNSTTELTDMLLTSLAKSRKERWIETMEKLDFKHSSREAWNLLRRLDSNPTRTKSILKIKPDEFANRIIEMTRATMDKETARKVIMNLKTKKREATDRSKWAENFFSEEVQIALKSRAGLDGIHPEFLKNCGPNTRKWLADFFSDILCSGKLPKLFKTTKVLTALKPEKPNDDTHIATKLLERLIYNRISKTIDEVLPQEQAGFCPQRNFCDQVMALTTHIENGYDKKLKTAVAFVDLSSAYDTVWRKDLLSKFLDVIPCKTLLTLLNNMLSNRQLTVYIGEEKSKTRVLNNGLPQGSVLGPLLFNLYTKDLPSTYSKKFIYADDIALASQSTSFEGLEEPLTNDLSKLDSYFKRWRLKPNPTKTEVTVFHLNNKKASQEININFGGQEVRNTKHPKYLGVVLDRTLTYREHLTRLSAK